MYDSGNAPINIYKTYWVELMELGIKIAFVISYNAMEPWIVYEKLGTKCKC
jgi:hypothetical protein